jgi:diguanylate cyclase (GGDEF)-like protein
VKPLGAEPTTRSWSLRREWSRAFATMLALLIVATVGTFVGVRLLIGQFSGTARQLDQRMTILNSLDAAEVSHEGAAHQLLNGAPVDRAAFVAQQASIIRLFDQASRVFGGSDGGGLLTEARAAWQASMTGARLWSDGAGRFTAPTVVDGTQRAQTQLGADADGARRFLRDLEQPSIGAMHEGFADASGLERQLSVAFAVLIAMALGVTAYFRRRMSKDLVRPLASVHDGVLRLQAGDYGHRIEISRRDELGELAEAFNGMAGALQDIHVDLTFRATHDPLTGLPNRASLTEWLVKSFNAGAAIPTAQSVLFVDIDDFKDVNDSLGHDGGDDLLVQLAARLNRSVRPRDLVARLGGDEFAIVVEGDRAGIDLELAERILDACRAPFTVNGARLVVSVSIGVAQRRPVTVDADELLRQADFAMYMAKGGGKGRYQLFDAQMHHQMVGRIALKADLGVAAPLGQLRLEYQPVADLRTGEIVGVEALVRWAHPVLGLVAPADFIPLAEETGDIDAIGIWVLETAIRQVGEWRRSMPHCAEMWVSVNVSGHQLVTSESRAAIQHLLADPTVDADMIVLEITETAVTSDVEGGIASLNAWRRYGVRVALDDFGTGFASLSTLATLPLDMLKIDRSFISGPHAGATCVPIVAGILGLAGKLGLDVVAEGIEQRAELELIRGMGCRLGQGYLLARPSSAQAIEALLSSGGLLQVTPAESAHG